VLLDIDANARAAASIAPQIVLAGAVPRLIDEWQIEPAIWNHVRRAVDDRQHAGQFILTGSAVPADDITRHTGAARITRLRMRPMSLFETGHSAGTVSLKTLLTSGPGTCPDPALTVEDIATQVAIGGWPSHRTRAVPQALQAVRDYLDEIRRVDISRIDNVRRDPDRVGRLLASLARNVATSVSITALAYDTGGADGPLKDDTAREYLAALDRLMIIEDQPAWAPHLRSRSILRTAPKRHFVDPSLAVAALRATPARLLREIKWLGFLFESLVIRDLRIYAQANDAVVRHYRDNTGLEVDAIVETAAGEWAAFEVKLGQKQVDEAAANLLTFTERVDTTVCGRPATLAVIVATGYGYVRPDGVAVIPVGALAP
jgi:predicted AAA+ superfamily ATPase